MNQSLGSVPSAGLHAEGMQPRLWCIQGALLEGSLSGVFEISFQDQAEQQQVDARLCDFG